MPKTKRKHIVIESLSYNFDQRYNQEMAEFDDCHVINVHVLSRTKTSDSIREEYLVFYQEIEED